MNTETNTEKPDSAATSGRVQRLVLSYLRTKYGGNVRALKPPLGWFYYIPIKERMSYYKKFAVWKFDCVLFRLFGKPMRDAWDKWQHNYFL